MKIGESDAGKGIELKWLGHAGFLIKNSRAIYIDPYMIKDIYNSEKADIILITHSHYDHCSIADMKKIVKEGTIIIMPADCQSKITKFNVPISMKIMEPGQELDIGNVKISGLPAYNTDKHFHPKDENWLGYLIKMNNIFVYHAGDTDVIPEMQKLTGCCKEGNQLIALLPVGGRFTMTAEEAADAASKIRPTLAIPIHYGSIVGSEEDAGEFVKLCKEQGINAEILEKS